MAYRGDIIEESLQDKTVLKRLRIIATRTEPTTPAHKTPWLKQWTLHTIEVDDGKAPEIAEELSHKIERSHNGHWYIDFKNDTTHFIIFPDKFFQIDRNQPEQYKPAVEYGLTRNIPSHQLDFSLAIKQWERSKK